MAGESVSFASFNFSQSLIVANCPKFYKKLKAVNWDSVIDYSTLTAGQVKAFLNALTYFTPVASREAFDNYRKNPNPFINNYKSGRDTNSGYISFGTLNNRVVYTILFPISGYDTVLPYSSVGRLQLPSNNASVFLHGPTFLEDMNPIVLCLLFNKKVYYDELLTQENATKNYFMQQKNSSGTGLIDNVEAVLGISEGGDFGIAGLHKNMDVIIPQVKVGDFYEDNPDFVWKRFYSSIYISGVAACNLNGSITFPGIKKIVYPAKTDSEILMPYYYSTASPNVKNNQYTCFQPWQEPDSKIGEPIIIHTTSTPTVAGIQIRFRMNGLFKQQVDKNEGEPMACKYFFYVHARKLGSTSNSDWFPVVNQGADNSVVTINPQDSLNSTYSDYFNSIFIYGASRKDAYADENKVEMIDTTTTPPTKLVKVDYTDTSYKKKLDAEIRSVPDIDYTIAYNLSNSQVVKSSGSISYYLGDRNIWMSRTFWNVNQKTRLLGDLIITPGTNRLDWIPTEHSADWHTFNFNFQIVQPHFVNAGDGSVTITEYSYKSLLAYKEVITGSGSSTVKYLKYTVFDDVLEIGREDSYDTMLTPIYNSLSASQKSVYKAGKTRTRTIYISYANDLPSGTKFLQGDLYFCLSKETAFYYTGLHWYASGLSFFPDQLGQWIPFQGQDNFVINSYNNIGTGWYNDTGDFDRVITPTFQNLAYANTVSEAIKWNIYSFSGNEQTPFTYDFLFPLPKDGGTRYELRIGFPVHSLSKIQDITVESVTELFNGHIPLKGIATAQFLIPFKAQEAKDFAINGIYDGVKVRIPSNYDGRLRRINVDGDGEPIPWDGKFKIPGEWTDCPAWIIYALLVDEKFGMVKQQPKLKKGYDSDGNPIYRINKWSFYEFQLFCDRRIYNKPPNVSGYQTSGSEPRFSFNYYLNETTTIDKIISKICAEYGANLYTDAFGDICITADYDYPPVAVFTKSNVIDGEFLYSESLITEQYNAFVATFNNYVRDYKEQSVRIEMPWAIKNFGLNETTASLYGCVKESEAKRRTRLKLFKSIYSSRTITFNTGSQGAYLNVGNKILVYDYSVMDTQTGRVVEMVSLRTLKLSKEISLINGVTYNLTFNIVNPNYNLNGKETDLAFKVVERTLTHNSPSISTTTITLDDDLPEILPDDSIFTITNTDEGYGTLWQITNIATQQNQTSVVASYFDIRQNNYMDYGSFTISDDTEEEYIDRVIQDPNFTYTEPPGYINTSLIRIKDKNRYDMRLTWPVNSKPIQGYEVTMYNEYDIKKATVKSATYTFENIPLKDLMFSVRTISKTGEYSSEVYCNFRYSLGVLIYETPYNLRSLGYNGSTDIKPNRDLNFTWEYTDTADWESFDIEFYGNSFMSSNPSLGYSTLLRKVNVKTMNYTYKKSDILADFQSNNLVSSTAKFVPFTNDNGLKVVVNPIMNSALLYKGNGKKTELFVNPVLNSPNIQNLTYEILSLVPPSAKINVAIRNPTDPYITSFDIYYSTVNSSSSFVFYGTITNKPSITGSQVFSSTIQLNSKYSSIYVKVLAKSDYGDISDFSAVEVVDLEWD